MKGQGVNICIGGIGQVRKGTAVNVSVDRNGRARQWQRQSAMNDGWNGALKEAGTDQCLHADDFPGIIGFFVTEGEAVG